MTQRFNPYTDLKRRFGQFATECISRHRKSMWVYPKARLSEGWKLSDLWERCAAAEQLDYDVQLRATEEGLLVQYVKKPPARPYDI